MSGRPARVAFVGDEAILGPAMPAAGAIDLRPTLTVAEIRQAFAAARPEVLILLGPPFPPAETLDGLGALVIAHATEPAAVPFADRLLCTVPADGAWRVAPVPVDDRFFAAVRPSATPPRVLFLGRSSEHRERFFARAKHEFDVLHVADGVRGDDLAALLDRTDVGLNAHRAPVGPAFEHRVALHLAAGHLLVSEPLGPAHGLEPGIDFLQVADGDDLARVVASLRLAPQAAHRVRVRGRLKAERFRASRVWSRLIADARRDLAAFGRTGSTS